MIFVENLSVVVTMRGEWHFEIQKQFMVYFVIAMTCHCHFVVFMHSQLSLKPIAVAAQITSLKEFQRTLARGVHDIWKYRNGSLMTCHCHFVIRTVNSCYIIIGPVAKWPLLWQECFYKSTARQKNTQSRNENWYFRMYSLYKQNQFHIAAVDTNYSK